MPSRFAHRWREVGVLTRNGSPNAAMKNWANYLLAGDETDGVLGEILLILRCVYDEGSNSASEMYKDGGITV